MTNTDWISLAHKNQDLSLPPFINIKHNKSTKFHHFQSVGNKLIENSLISMALKVLTNMSYLIKVNKVFIKIPSTYNTTPMRNIIFDSMTLTKDLSMWFPQSTSNTYINSIKPYLNFHLLSFSQRFSLISPLSNYCQYESPFFTMPFTRQFQVPPKNWMTYPG